MNINVVQASLQRAGWSIDETSSTSGWLVSGTKGEDIIQVRGVTRDEAWRRAAMQAAAVGMLAPDLPQDI